MAILIRIEEPASRAPAGPGWKPFLSFAFRPFYLLAAVQGALFVLLWVAGFQGTAALPGLLWHAHEMIWGYAGAVIVGFLLTAVATWTGRPPLAGTPLALLVALWLAARIALLAFPHDALPGAALSVAFFVASAALLAHPIAASRNVRNYVVPPILLGFAAANLAFHLSVAGIVELDARRLLHVGLLIVAGVICFVGMRVIAFFTAKGLGIEQVPNSKATIHAAVGLPFVLAALVAFDAPAALAGPVALAAGAINLVRLVRWWHPQVAKRPLLWVLFAGYGFTAAGLVLAGVAQWLPQLASGAMHSIAVGGVGVLTLGMMTRTALGHTGRTLQPPKGMPAAYGLMVLAALLRLAAAHPSPASPALIVASGLAFAAALALFAWRYAPWLASPRADGRP